MMYIPVCPTTELNAEYVARQRSEFLEGFPAPDFPGGNGESDHIGRPGAEYLLKNTGSRGLKSMGLSKLEPMEWEASAGATEVIRKANKILGFT